MPATIKPAFRRALSFTAAARSFLDDGLLRHDLLRRLDHPAGGRGLRGRGGGRQPVWTALAVAGVVALALEGPAVTLAHRNAPGIWLESGYAARAGTGERTPLF